MHKDRVFIDRDGEAFCAMLSFLRTGKVPMFQTQAQEHGFYDELDFWMVPTEPEVGAPSYGPGRVYQTINTSINVGDLNCIAQAFDSEWCAETLTLEDQGKTLKKAGSQHGIVFCKSSLDIFNSYIEFKVRIDAIFGGKSHLFLGMVDQSKQRQENLSKCFQRANPSTVA